MLGPMLFLSISELLVDTRTLQRDRETTLIQPHTVANLCSTHFLSCSSAFLCFHPHILSCAQPSCLALARPSEVPCTNHLLGEIDVLVGVSRERLRSATNLSRPFSWTRRRLESNKIHNRHKAKLCPVTDLALDGSICSIIFLVLL